MAKSASPAPPEKLAQYDALIAARPEMERKGKTTPYTSLNGHMFSFLSKEGEMGLRLSAVDREAFLADHNTVLMEQHGRTMKEYVAVPEALLADTSTLLGYLDKSFNYVGTLKPKPTKKK